MWILILLQNFSGKLGSEMIWSVVSVSTNRLFYLPEMEWKKFQFSDVLPLKKAQTSVQLKVYSCHHRNLLLSSLTTIAWLAHLSLFPKTFLHLRQNTKLYFTIIAVNPLSTQSNRILCEINQSISPSFSNWVFVPSFLTQSLTVKAKNKTGKNTQYVTLRELSILGHWQPRPNFIPSFPNAVALRTTWGVHKIPNVSPYNN